MSNIIYYMDSDYLIFYKVKLDVFWYVDDIAHIGHEWASTCEPFILSDVFWYLLFFILEFHVSIYKLEEGYIVFNSFPAVYRC